MGEDRRELLRKTSAGPGIGAMNAGTAMQEVFRKAERSVAVMQIMAIYAPEGSCQLRQNGVQWVVTPSIRCIDVMLPL